jgi:hypothetical protein
MANIIRNNAKLVALGLETLRSKKPIAALRGRRGETKKRDQRGSHGHIGSRVFVVWNEWEPYSGTVTKYDPGEPLLCRVRRWG